MIRDKMIKDKRLFISNQSVALLSARRLTDKCQLEENKNKNLKAKKNLNLKI